MSHANWQERLACQRRWRRKNRAKVRAQKRRARIKKKCLSKSLVVVLDDYRKRMSTPVTKTLTVVLDDCRLKKSPPPPPPKNEKRNARNERFRNYYQLNRERIRAQRTEYRQRNLEKCRVQARATSQRYRQSSRGAECEKEYRRKNRAAINERRRGHPEKRCVERQKEWQRKNRDVINERRREQRRTNRDALNEKRREHRRQHRDAINRAEREYQQKHGDALNQRKRVPKRLNYWMKRIATRAEEPTTTPCDCGLCLACGGFETESWSRSVVVPRSDPLETLERRLDRLDACSDTSSEVDPRLEEELERVLNETSSDEADSEPEEDDVVEQRLGSLRSHRDDGMKQRLGRWKKEEAASVLSAEVGGVTTELRDMERWFQQFHRENEAQPDEYTQTLMVTSNLMNELERFLFS